MKTDWERINGARVRDGFFATRDSDGFNGFFVFKINGLPVNVIASDGSDQTDPKYHWRHVSVSLPNRNIPSWSIMAQVKQIFWGGDEWVVEYHPPASEYVNNHEGVLHLWQPVHGTFPTPPSELVGAKGVTTEQVTPEFALKEFVRMNLKQ